ncbi:MAG: M20/M25/M40 family metallo-hydrolase [bacterium]
MKPEQQLIQWLEIDSTSGDEAAFLEVLERHFVSLGYRAARQAVAEDRWNLLLTRDGHPPNLLFSTHVDTVPPFLPVRTDGSTVWGRGACDTKGGIVAMAEAGNRLIADGIESFGYLFVVGEEVDHCGAKVAQGLPVETQRIILCEPTQNRVVRAQKGMVKLTLRASGIAGHSAFPGKGESAVDKLLDVISAIRTTSWPSDPVLGPTTINVGLIEGGVAANVFAPSASAEILIRAVAPVAPMIEAIRSICDGVVEVDFPASNDPVFFDPPQAVETCTVPFNTDATYLSTLAPVWLVGPGDISTAHSDHEHIHLRDLEAGIALYEALARRSLA